MSIILQVHFCYTETTETNIIIFAHKTRWRRTERVFSVVKQTLRYYLHYRADGAFPGTSADNRSRILVCPRYTLSLDKVDRCSLSDLPRRGPPRFDLGLNLGVSTPIELSEKYRVHTRPSKSSKSKVNVTEVDQIERRCWGPIPPWD